MQKVDASEVATSTLWRALEEQKAQCDEDEKWLAEEEEKLVSVRTTIVGNDLGFSCPKASCDQGPSLPQSKRNRKSSWTKRVI